MIILAYEHFKGNLKYLRLKNGMEQLELAEMLGFKSSSAVSEWEKGIRIPPISTLSDISQIFNEGLSELMETDLQSEKVKPTTIAAHLPEGVELTEEEEEQLDDYVQFILYRRTRKYD